MSRVLRDSPSRVTKLAQVIGVCLLLTAVFRVRGDTVWQLTVKYDDHGFSLVGAAPVAATSKRNPSSELEASPLKLGYRLEWQDVAGKLLQCTSATIPLGLRSTLASGTESLSHQTAIPPSGAFVLRVAGPDNPTAPRRLRLVRAWTADTLGIGQTVTIPAAFTASEQGLTLPEYIPPQSLPRPLGGPVGGRKVRDTGPDANRLVIAVMGDGFTAADLAAGKFTSQVNRFLNRFLSSSPWDVYGNAVNVYQVDLVSNESGADYEDASPGSGGTLKDTYLDSQFWAGGVERCVYLDGTGITRAFAAADAIVGVGAWDKILVFVNSAKYGGCGGSVGVSSLHPSADEIQIHEFGHSFAGLADEYDYGLDSTNCVETTLRNVDCGFHLPNVKWSAWVDAGTPLPTPPAAEFANEVGAFEGGLYQSRGIYRPMLNCKMRSLGVPFCPICREAHVLKLFERIDLAGGATPAPAAVEVTTNLARSFGIDPIPVPSIAYRWFLDGKELAGETSASLMISNNGVAPVNGVLQVEATHSTPMVRAQLLQSRHSWDLTFSDIPTINAGDVGVIEGDSDTNEAIVTFTLSSPSSQPVSADFVTWDGTANASEDYLAASGQIVFQPGETMQAVSLGMLGDVQPESDEGFLVQLSNPVNARLQRTQASITIYDDDHPPTVALASPCEGDVFLEGQAIPVSVNATQPHGQITRVDIFSSGRTLLSLTNAPYVAGWGAPPGNHTLLAVATDGAGRSTTSAPVRLTVLATGQQRLSLLALTNAWRFDATTNDYGRAWTMPTFDDSAWRGPSNAVFFSANFPVAGPKRTPFTLTSNGARVRSVYFRTHFQFPGIPGPEVALLASNVVDDGAVFYLNGQEAGRLRMSSGDITRASAALPGGWATNFDVIRLESSSLVAGDNVLAVELHLASDTSFPATFGMSLDVVTGYAPVLERLATGSVKQRLTTFLAADLGGGRLALEAAGPTSAQGGNVQINGDWLFYTPPPGYTNADSFQFTVSDSLGVHSGNAWVTIRGEQLPAMNLQAEPLTDGSIQIAGDGMPGEQYAIESSESLATPNWQRLATVVADDSGRVQFRHYPPAGSPPLSYRALGL